MAHNHSDEETLAPPPINFKRVYVVEKGGKVLMCSDNYPLEYFTKKNRIWRIDNHKGQIEWYVRHERGIFMHRQTTMQAHSDVPPIHDSFDWRQFRDGCGGCLAVTVGGLLMCFAMSYGTIRFLEWLTGEEM